MERDFFAAQPGLAKPRPLGLLVIDFDETITEADTTAKIARAAIMANVAKARTQGGGLLLVGRGRGWGALGRRRCHATDVGSRRSRARPCPPVLAPTTTLPPMERRRRRIPRMPKRWRRI